MAIRVVRLLEYVYPNIEKASEDMERWEVPASGGHRFGTEVIRSAILPVEVLFVEGGVDRSE